MRNAVLFLLQSRCAQVSQIQPNHGLFRLLQI